MNIVIGLAAGASLGTAWLAPGTLYSSLFTWLATILVILNLEGLARRPRWKALFGLYLCGCFSHLLAFHWLYTTIADFGGFPSIAAGAIFGLFVLVSSLQFPLVGLVYRGLPRKFDVVAIRGAVAWVTLETLFFRIFPWQLGHTHSALLPFVQIADIGGVTLLSFLTFWLCEVMVSLFRRRASIELGALALATLVGVLGYGYFSMNRVEGIPGTAVEVALVQGNISLHEKHDAQSFAANRARYIAMSSQVAKPGMLIVWPESVVTEFLHDKLRDAYMDSRLPQMPRVSFLLGALTAESRERYFNSAVAIDSNVRVLEPYHKQILMPFGEFTPFGELLPWLKRLNSTAPDFTPGDGVRVFKLPHVFEEHVINVSPLICYEDIIPQLSRTATREGAELLVNLTNDAWFGKTIAPYQHHLIASFRAIENRRFLLRSTNSGLTAIVDPIGRTVAQLPIYTEGSLLDKVDLIGYRSIYTEFIGELPWLAVSLAAVLLAVFASLGRWTHVKRNQRKYNLENNGEENADTLENTDSDIDT